MTAEPAQRRVLTFGEPLVVMVPDAPGPVSPMHLFRPYPAGAELNTAVGLTRLGLQSSFACCVGSDAFGEFLLAAARGEGVDVRHVQLSQSQPTGMFIKEWAGLHRRTSVYYYRAGSAMAVGEWDPADVRTGISTGDWDWVHSTGITWMIGQKSGETASELFHLAHHEGIPVSFDVNLRLKLAPLEKWKQLAKDVLPYVTWFLTGDEEARSLFGTDSAQALEQQLREWGFQGKGVVIKRGDKGASASIQNSLQNVPAWRVTEVVDTVGAGDGFNAGFIAGLLRGDSIGESLRLGTLVGAFAVTRVGDYQGYPTWNQALEELSGKGGVDR